MFAVLLVFLRALKVKVNFNLRQFLGCEMPENGPESLDQIIKNLLTQNSTKEHITSLRSHKKCRVSQKNCSTFD